VEEHIELLKEKLRTLMSDISEDHYCAGWLSGLEYSLWDIITEYPFGNRQFGMGKVSEENIIQLSLLSKSVDGWWIFDNDLKDERFVTLEEWDKIRNG
jgi:hypothetical protein